MSISALMPVYNEESRIESTLRTLQWCDEIVILDKNSTDSTREIAEKYGAKIYIWDKTEYDANEISFLIERCTSEWVIIFTASDVIHPRLALEIKELTGRKDFEYDIISVPFYTYILGIDSKRSPWHTDLKSYVFRRKTLQLSQGVHDAIQFNSQRIFKLEKSTEFCVYHLTHISVNIMMERHMRYWRGEAQYFDDPDLKKPFNKVIREFLKIVFKKKTYLMGWNGIMLSFAFLSYFMMSFVYKWEKKHNMAPQVYGKIRDDLAAEWEKLK
jgi:glycosyltransferase involved in cell wall biosynthesis